mgnify:CR=1 FL=1
MTNEAQEETMWACDFQKGQTITVRVEGFEKPVRCRVYDACRYQVWAKRTINGLVYHFRNPLGNGLGRWSSTTEWELGFTLPSTRIKSKPLTRQQREDIDVAVLAWGEYMITRDKGDFQPRDAVAWFCCTYERRLPHFDHFGDDHHAHTRRKNAVHASIQRIYREGIWAKDKWGYTSPDYID